MGKKNTVRIDMEVFNRAIEAAGYASPKAFCELELGFSDGWYYTIRNHGGRGVKVLVAELIARRLGIDIEALVIPDKPDHFKLLSGENINSQSNCVESVNVYHQLSELFQTAARTFEEIAEYYERMERSE